MKIGILAGVFILVMTGTLAGILALNGQLSMETLQKIKGPEAPKKVEPDTSPLDALALQLKAKEQELKKKSELVSEQEKRIELATQDLKETLSRLSQDIQAEQATQNKKKQEQEQALSEQAATLEKMDPAAAAVMIQNSWTPEYAAQVLSRIAAGKRAEILNELTNANFADVAGTILMRIEQAQDSTTKKK